MLQINGMVAYEDTNSYLPNAWHISISMLIFNSAFSTSSFAPNLWSVLEGVAISRDTQRLRIWGLVNFWDWWQKLPDLREERRGGSQGRKGHRSSLSSAGQSLTHCASAAKWGQREARILGTHGVKSPLERAGSPPCRARWSLEGLESAAGWGDGARPAPCNGKRQR